MIRSLQKNHCKVITITDSTWLSTNSTWFQTFLETLVGFKTNSKKSKILKMMCIPYLFNEMF